MNLDLLKKTLLHVPFFIVLFIICSCTSKNSKTNYSDGNHLAQWNSKLTEVIVGDIFNPPVASRIYAYTNIAAYEVIRNINPKYGSWANKLNGLKSLPIPDSNKEYNYEAAALVAYFSVASKMVYSEKLIKDHQNILLDSLKTAGLSDEVLNNSKEYGKAIADKIIKWSAKDFFSETRKMKRYTPINLPNSWQPTSPDYMPASEPYWGNLRTFALDSAGAITVEKPILFNVSKTSDYMKMVYEVYETGKQLTTAQKDIAYFWDDNPNVSTHSGHAGYQSQKMGPGGHWIAILSNQVRQKKLDMITTAQAYAITSIAMADAFKACWHEKFRLNTVRPITVIDHVIDKDWNPLIQTPPFPEYPSGHSTISASAATVLTALLGDHCAFTDSSEYQYIGRVRKFTSFNEAAAEAAKSRMYGGIHFRFSNESGAVLGKKIAKHALDKLKPITNATH